MPGLFSTIITAAGALRAFDRGLATAQNNVANAGTPGYARQQQTFLAAPFDLDAGMMGGIRTGDLASARDEYAEQSVRRELQSWGRDQQLAATMSRVEPLFDATGESGIPRALSALFQSFSALATEPNDAVARRVVLDRAEDLAARFRETATTLRQVRQQTESEVEDAVAAVNRISEQICQWNKMARSSQASKDPNLDAELTTWLEELAQNTDFTALKRDDGSITIMLGGGQSPLVIGDQFFELKTNPVAGGIQVTDANGQDITGQIGSGRIAAAATLRNTTVPGYIADLDRLAAALADRVNEVLAGGIDSNGGSGAPLFSYDAEAGAALSIAAEPLTVSQLAAAGPDGPGGNANALALAALGESGEIGGESFVEFYGAVAARAGRDLSIANQAAAASEGRVTTARDLRDVKSAVSLDEEAVRVMQLQRSYQAASKLINVLDELTETTINLLR